jgi:signal transduction histidine kinase
VKNGRQDFFECYAKALRDGLATASEEALHAVYEMGRKASAEGVGVLEVAKAHHQAMISILPELQSRGGASDHAGHLESYLMEALSPFEAQHRGFQEANNQLRKLNEALQDRAKELAGINRDLHLEISKRQASEKALRKSKEHYRDLFNEATSMQEKLRELSSKILNAQEAERRRISRELHDEVGQALTAISVNLQLLKNRAGELGPRAASAIMETQKLLEGTMDNVHRFSHELRPAMLDDLGLVTALRWYVKAFAERTGYKVRLDLHPAVEELESDPKTVIYRIVQESLNNVYKYAKGSRVGISIRKQPTQIQIVIKDDGIGFRLNGPRARLKKKGGLGLVGMEERLRLINGKLVVESEIGKGTSIRATIPLKNKRSHGATE